jgi:protein SCO1/2
MVDEPTPMPRGPKLQGEERWALVTLGAILGITVAWWALALWPLPDTAPRWLARTREVCFGNSSRGLPPPGGWILLVSQPVGMLAVLLTVWGGALRSGLAAMARGWTGRLVVGVTGLTLIAGLAAVGRRVATADVAYAAGVRGGRIVALEERAPALRLVNQHGDTVALEQFRGRPVLVTFAFSHCETVCPVLVRAAVETRRRFDANRVVTIIVTLDPWRDPPARLPALAARWDLQGDEYVLSGSVEAVEGSLNGWKVPRVRNQATGDLIHPAVTYVVNPAGRLAYLTDGSGSGLEEAMRQVDRWTGGQEDR